MNFFRQCSCISSLWPYVGRYCSPQHSNNFIVASLYTKSLIYYNNLVVSQLTPIYLMYVGATTGDDLHISVNMRGGPEKWQVTGWLQIINLQKSHEGDYTCVAQNEFGLTKSKARINVIVKDEGQLSCV
jgi:hypothetical protein